MLRFTRAPPASRLTTTRGSRMAPSDIFGCRTKTSDTERRLGGCSGNRSGYRRGGGQRDTTAKPSHSRLKKIVRVPEMPGQAQMPDTEYMRNTLRLGGTRQRAGPCRPLLVSLCKTDQWEREAKENQHNQHQIKTRARLRRDGSQRSASESFCPRPIILGNRGYPSPFSRSWQRAKPEVQFISAGTMSPAAEYCTDKYISTGTKQVPPVPRRKEKVHIQHFFASQSLFPRP